MEMGKRLSACERLRAPFRVGMVRDVETQGLKPWACVAKPRWGFQKGGIEGAL